MTERPILRLPDGKRARRLTGSSNFPPPPKPRGRRTQEQRFKRKIDRIADAISGPDAEITLRQDPMGIAPERALVFVSAVPIQNFVRAATGMGLEVFAEVELDSLDGADDFLAEIISELRPTLYATMPTMNVLEDLLRLWKRYSADEKAPTGSAPWWNLFDMLADLRPWGPLDRLTEHSRRELLARLEAAGDDKLRLEFEFWPTNNSAKRTDWRRDAENRIAGEGGTIISSCTIDELGFVYDAMLVELPTEAVTRMLDGETDPNSLAMLDGLQFIWPQSIAQSLPDDSDPLESGVVDASGSLDDDAPIRAILLDGLPIAAHEQLDGGVVIEDIHDLEPLSQVEHRKHATAMASLILRGDVTTDGEPVPDARLVSIPLLIDTERGATSPDDRLFADLVHIAFQRAFGGDEPLAPDAFVVNFSIGVVGQNFAGRIGSLARLLDWWAERAGILIMVSAGNASDPIYVAGTTTIDFEALDTQAKIRAVENCLGQNQHERTLLAPAEAMNSLTVGAVNADLSDPAFDPPAGEIVLCENGHGMVAVASRSGLGPFRSIKPDIVGVGGQHNLRCFPSGNDVQLRLVSTNRTGLNVASSNDGIVGLKRERGTSCANALAVRAALKAAAALTADDGPYQGAELERQDLALLTKCLLVHSASWPDAANELFEQAQSNGGHHSTNKESVARFYGHGLFDVERMCEAPSSGATLVGLGTLRKDQANIFEMPLPASLSGVKLSRSMVVTLAWFSPTDPVRARYRLAALEAVAADGDMTFDGTKDGGWHLRMKADQLDANQIKRGTVWSKRLTNEIKTTPDIAGDAILPIRVQCRDSSGGGLSPDEDIRFAIAVSLETEIVDGLDIHQEIRERLQVPVVGVA